MLRSRNHALRTAPATLSAVKNAGQKRSSIGKTLTLTAVAAGITAGSLLGMGPAHALTKVSGPAPVVPAPVVPAPVASTRTIGDCTVSAKLLVDYDPVAGSNVKGRGFRVEGVGDVRCLTTKFSISAELLLTRNGETVERTSGTWMDTRSLGGQSIWTQPYVGSTLLGFHSGCGNFQSILNVPIHGLGSLSVTSGAPVSTCG